MPEIPTVAELLTTSRQAHTEYRKYAGTVDRQGKITQAYDEAKCVAAVSKALAAREQADRLDPHHDDPAWLVDGDIHEQLLTFYRKFLA